MNHIHWLALIPTVFLLLRLIVVALNLVTRPWLRDRLTTTLLAPGNNHESDIEQNKTGKDIGSSTLISVLIPARNEEKNIGALLQKISAFHPKCNGLLQIEVIVYDDLSDDNTAAIVEEHSRLDDRCRLVRGKRLPPGWLGKNHACHNLALEAKGDYLLFLDSDVIIEEDLLPTALSHLISHKLELLSIFPQQIMKSLGERITVPLMNWILVTLLPLQLTRISSWPAFSAANGQFMLFRATTYRKYMFHLEVRSQKVEDIAIFRSMKNKKLRVQTLLSNGMIKCRMYRGFREALQGFSKNVFAFFGGSIAASMLFAAITTLGFLPVWIAWGCVAMAAYLLIAMLLRVFSAIASRQDALSVFWIAPLQQFAFLLVIYVATANTLRKKTQWKGRFIDM